MSSLCRRSGNDHDHPRPPSSTSPLGGSSKLIALIALLFAAAAAQPVYANDNNVPRPPKTETRVVEWDLPVIADGRPGAISVDQHGNPHKNDVWFVTRETGAPEPPETVQGPRVYKLEVPRDLKLSNSRWSSWSLHQLGLGPTGGIKKLRHSWDRRFVFVRTVTALHKVDTQTNLVTMYEDHVPNFVSDVTADQWNRVYFASRGPGVGPASDPTQVVVIEEDGFLKRIEASDNTDCRTSPCPNAPVVKWQVGGGVGLCQDNGSGIGPCLSGVAVHPKQHHLVYYSDNAQNYIGELDTSTNSKSCNCPFMSSKTRRWSLNKLNPPGDTSPAEGPRQLNIDSDGIIWVVTGSGHLVSLNPKTNKMTKHKIPNSLTNDPFGVAPDGGFIGYTLNEQAVDHKVGMLIPKSSGVLCPPDTVWVPRSTEVIAPKCETAHFARGEVRPIPRTVPLRTTPDPTGTFIEALIDQNTNMTQLRQSRVPMGMTPDKDRSTGAFFFAVGEPFPEMTVNRIGHVRLRDQIKGKHDRDDEDEDDDGKPRGQDDDDDDDGKKNADDDDDDNDGIHDVFDDDDDNDGIENEHDTKDNKESKQNHRSSLSSSQAEEFDVAASPNALLLLATAIADEPLTPISLEVVNAATGQVVGSSPAAPGAAVVTILAPTAGSYIVRVKNMGVTNAGIATSILTREPRLP